MQKSEFSFEMKRVLIFFFCYPGICLGQIQFDFEKHTLNTWDQSRPESWDTTSQNPLAGNASLIHSFDNPESGHDQVCFSLDSLDLSAGPAEWQFMVQHLYNPSSANNWCVYLLSDKDAMNMHPAGQANGYVVGINFLGSDDLLKIWKIKNRNISVVAGTEVNWQDDITIHSAARIRVTRTVQGDWELFIDHPGFESGWTAVGTGHDDELTDMRYCGIYYEYSSKQDRKLLLDDILINGDFYRDTIPPGFKWVELKDSNMLHVQFSENLDTIPSKDLMNFIVDQDIGNPQEINIIAPDEYMLTFSQGFPDGITCILEIRNIRDMKGNTSDTLRHEFVYYIPKKYDIVINEIMTDPSPPMGLPEYEFVELLNRSHYKIHLMDWTMSCGKTTRVFPSVTIQPDSMLLVIHKDATGMFKTFGKSCPVFTSKAQLSNAGSLIVLEDAHGNIIDWLDYTVDWHANDYFGRGGWSLERIDTERRHDSSVQGPSGQVAKFTKKYGTKK